ncbi:PilZ domain-containing protein [Halopseudomonas sp.]|uniref:PilZ domain-containing protein n=1 Tax=Halopseudomonas sp. TaxID=2901191 RepID=UPI0035615541
MSEDRRRFTRIPFDAQTSLRQDGVEFDVQLVDVSLHGLLVIQPPDWTAVSDHAQFNAVIQLAEGSQIRMDVHLAHAEEGLLGFECDHIDLDSISHLKRLVALNTGDEKLLERELGGLL